MLDHLAGLYRDVAARMVLVTSPEAAATARDAAVSLPMPVDVAIQPEPTGMLDAILLARPLVESAAGRVWITWCDQIAVEPDTIARLAALSRNRPDAAIVMPTARRVNPYIHFDRDAGGRITAVRHQREGDAMPAVGESDMGLFSLGAETYLDALPAFAREAVSAAGTGERNFLPFVPWIAARQTVITFPCLDEREAVGVNTPEDRAVVEGYLRSRR
jgi:bifunctional UDP-N-acetylglucosamine pyrophosphorylase/glucosamine-1-phosphate N-acetyltransferase